MFLSIQISPAASHSGWEDHFQSDQYHYLHHRFFECNYGTSGTPFDKMFGTFRDRLKETGTSYKGGSEERVDERAASVHDAKASLRGRGETAMASRLGRLTKVRNGRCHYDTELVADVAALVAKGVRQAAEL